MTLSAISYYIKENKILLINNKVNYFLPGVDIKEGEDPKAALETFYENYKLKIVGVDYKGTILLIPKDKETEIVLVFKLTHIQGIIEYENKFEWVGIDKLNDIKLSKSTLVALDNLHDSFYYVVKTK